MKINTNHVIGLPIFSIDEGKNIHNVEDVVYDPSTQRIQALIVSSGGIFSDGKVIDINDIHSIGDDAVVIQSEQLLKKTSELDASIKHIANDDTYLTKSRVMTEDGKDLGKVVDLIFDSSSGQVEELEISQGGLRDMQSGRKRVKPSNIITVGQDALIVNSYTQVAFDSQAEQGGMQGAINSAKSATQDAIESAKQRWESPETQDKLSQAKAKITSTYEESKDKLQQTTEDAQMRFNQAKQDPENQQRLEELKVKATQAAEDLKHHATQSSQSAAQALDKGKEGMQTKMEELGHKQQMHTEDTAVGQYVTRNVLDPQDKVIARRGDMVTHSVLNRAKDAGILDTVLQNVSAQPVYTAGMLGGEVTGEQDSIEVDRDSSNEEENFKGHA